MGNNSSSTQGVKRCVWEASVSSLKSKRIKGGHCIHDCQEIQDLDSNCVRETDASPKDCSLGITECQPLGEITPTAPTDINQSGSPAEQRLSGHLDKELVLNGHWPRIMFMNIADDAKKTCLTKVINCVSL